jgi:hypothetical protein
LEEESMSKFHITEAFPGVHLSLSQYTKDEAGNILLTSDLASDQEIDYAIEALKKELNQAGAQAKKKLERMRERVKKEGLFHTEPGG